MTQLCRMTTWGQQQLAEHFREVGRLPEDPGSDAGWYETHPDDCALRVDLTPSLSAFAGIDVATTTHDADHAIALHEALSLPRRLAADRTLWPWLATFAFAAYTRTRWEEGERVTAARVSRDLAQNALARLWWGAENTRVSNPGELTRGFGFPESHDPYAFTRLYFASYTLNFELGRRLLSFSRAAVIAFIIVTQRQQWTSAEIVRALAAYNLTLSTVVVEHFDIPWEDGDRYATDPHRVGQLCNLIEEITSTA
jgi:uncharacterized protein DUF6339